MQSYYEYKKSDLTTLWAAYQDLSIEEKTVLRMLAIIYESVSGRLVGDCLEQWGFCDENKQIITKVKLNGIIEKLLNNKFIIYNPEYQCNKLILNDVVMDTVEAGVFQSMLQAVRGKFPYSLFMNRPVNFYRCIRELRASVCFGGYSKYNELIRTTLKYFKNKSERDINDCIYGFPFQLEWLSKLKSDFQKTFILFTTRESIFFLRPMEDVITLCKKNTTSQKQFNDFSFCKSLMDIYILQGKFEDAEILLNENVKAVNKLEYQGMIEFLKGNNNNAISCFSESLKELNQRGSSKKVYFAGLSGLIYLLALIKRNDSLDHAKILNIAQSGRKKDNLYKISYDSIKALVLARENMLPDVKSVLLKNRDSDFHSIDLIIYSFVSLGFYPEMLDNLKNILEEYFKRSVENGYEWATMELAEILSRIHPDDKKYCEVALEIRSRAGMESLFSMFNVLELWESRLTVLEYLNSGSLKILKNGIISRLVWFVDSTGTVFEPKEQTLSTKGYWSKGKAVALERIKSGKLNFMTIQDYKVAECIEVNEPTAFKAYDKQYTLNHKKAALAFVGHSLVFLEDSPKVGVQFLKDEPVLLVQRTENLIEIRFSVEFEKRGIEIVRETPMRFKVYEIANAHIIIRDKLGGNLLTVPLSGKHKVLAAIKNIAALITVHSDLDDDFSDVNLVEATAKTCVHILPVGDGIKFEMFAKPFLHRAPYFKPGNGCSTVYAEINGEKVKTQRGLEEEKKNANVVFKACPALVSMKSINDELFFEKPEDCLQLLSELDELGDSILLEWPEGGKLNVSRPISFDNLRLSIQKESDWFAVAGELKIDEDMVLDFRKLLDKVENSSGNYITLEKGFFLRLTNEFKRRLSEFAVFSEKTKDGNRFHALASLAVQDFISNVDDLTVDQNWTKHVKSLNDVANIKTEVPKSLNAKLRHYQIDGFNWLYKLANWGIGACLADDMGLGKTLQALALILERAKSGPTLVVAPASVCFNWCDEAEKFTPILNLIIFGRSDREKKLNDLKPYDLLICTYGLLQTEVDKLSKIVWSTIVLDEAQAIKNVYAKRSKAAMMLQGDFKLITTGTPIENHLSELWNLFSFINPGLLGSLDRFNKVFAFPIEKKQNVEVRKRLKMLIQPFILRRTKSQVATELPPKTEITLFVESTIEEVSFYETLRKQSLVNLNREKEDGKNISLKILAEIMKLRRACCHPQLVLPDSLIASSKLALFVEIVQELMDNGHKALVFSQFVGHLSIVAKKIEELGISYQYFDGETPVKERRKRVDAFQSGEGDLFLISIHAGGVGLNLTAADYVIHLDPWWNPAVEDQASDRAHRIGQQRPVTIYRFVTKNTIEEKIVELHNTKRNLADSLLDGTDVTGKISTDELLQLIRDV